MGNFVIPNPCNKAEEERWRQNHNRSNHTNSKEQQSFKRPFALFAKSPSKRRASQGSQDEGPPVSENVVKPSGDHEACDKKLDSEMEGGVGVSLPVCKNDGLPWIAPGRGLNTGWPAGLASPSYSAG